MTISDIMQNLQKDDGTFSEDDIKKLSEVTGKDTKELFSMFNQEDKTEPNIPAGKPSEWHTKDKTAFISEHGIDEFKRVVNERK